ncbi:Bug family tripartite tricarboxylate transporter substrate binding protein [Cupriavidus sp. 2TAF22]|uniref:Bug family tripartite tricarboxylate transporter substrate binding protein n=1 Tax=unclassified Cupriavidus TaxID=2640874 RepID=UPI003F91506F
MPLRITSTRPGRSPWRRLAAGLFAGTAMLAAGAAAAQSFDKPVTIVVPFPAGGTTDIVARALAVGMGDALKQTVIVDNRAGAGGNVGAEIVAHAKPDGYTLLVTTAGPLSINQYLYRRLGYDPAKDFAPVGLIATVPIMLVANTGQPFKTLPELIAYAKAHPGKLSYGSQGNGTTSHLTMELLKSRAGIDLLHVPYRGSSPAATDLMGGNVQVMFDNSPATLPFVEAQRMRALGVATPGRVPALKNVPAIAETVKGFESIAWFAIVAPAGTPANVVQALNAAMNATLKRPEVKEKFAASGVELGGGTPEVLARFIKSESAKWGTVIKTAGVHLD